MNLRKNYVVYDLVSKRYLADPNSVVTTPRINKALTLPTKKTAESQIEEYLFKFPKSKCSLTIISYWGIIE